MFADSDQWGILVYNLEILASGGASWFTFSMKYVCLPFQLLGASDPGQRVAAKLGFSAKFCQQQTFEHFANGKHLNRTKPRSNTPAYMESD